MKYILIFPYVIRQRLKHLDGLSIYPSAQIVNPELQQRSYSYFCQQLFVFGRNLDIICFS